MSTGEARGTHLRTLVVDDEPVARELMLELLARHADVEPLAPCADGPSAVEAIRASGPDLVLLDVEMPGLNGFQVLEQLAPAERPVVVFVTAFDAYAVRAFEVSAVDYLLKPVDDGRLAQALERARELRRPEGWRKLQARLERLLEAASDPGQEDGWLVVRRGDRRVPLRWEEIVWLEAAGNYVRVHAAGEEYLRRGSLSDLERRLAGLPFARVHRSAMVNVTRIVGMRAAGRGDYRLSVSGGATLPLSRRFRARLEELLGRLG